MGKIILWDLDGTLTDPKHGIIKSMQFALQSCGYSVPTESELLWCIGPPLQESFKTLHPELAQAEVLTLIEQYRVRFASIGLYENSVYPGIECALGDLRMYDQYVATSKPYVFAAPILNHFGLTSHFKGIFGSELDGTRSVKADVIRHVFATIGQEAEGAIMIGDRKHDILGAKDVGIRSIAVTWGYGTLDEISNARPDWIVRTPAELVGLLNEINLQ